MSSKTVNQTQNKQHKISVFSKIGFNNGRSNEFEGFEAWSAWGFCDTYNPVPIGFEFARFSANPGTSMLSFKSEDDISFQTNHSHTPQKPLPVQFQLHFWNPSRGRNFIIRGDW